MLCRRGAIFLAIATEATERSRGEESWARGFLTRGSVWIDLWEVFPAGVGCALVSSVGVASLYSLKGVEEN
jgi:hypothetical protein